MGKIDPGDAGERKGNETCCGEVSDSTSSKTTSEMMLTFLRGLNFRCVFVSNPGTGCSVRLELLLQMANKIQNMALDCEEKLTLAKNTLQAVSRISSNTQIILIEHK